MVIFLKVLIKSNTMRQQSSLLADKKPFNFETLDIINFVFIDIIHLLT